MRVVSESSMTSTGRRGGDGVERRHRRRAAPPPPARRGRARVAGCPRRRATRRRRSRSASRASGSGAHDDRAPCRAGDRRRSPPAARAADDHGRVQSRPADGRAPSSAVGQRHERDRACSRGRSTMPRRGRRDIGGADPHRAAARRRAGCAARGRRASTISASMRRERRRHDELERRALARLGRDTITSPPSRSTASRTTSRPMPRPETSVTALDVLMPPRNSRRTSSSAPSSPASAGSRPRRTAMRRTAAKSRPRPSSRHSKTIRRPRRKTSTLTRPTAGLPSRAPLGWWLDAMRHGVAHDLHERALHARKDMGIEADVAARRPRTAISCDSACAASRAVRSSAVNRRRRRNQPQLLGRVAQLAQLAIHLLDRRVEAALEPADFRGAAPPPSRRPARR